MGHAATATGGVSAAEARADRNDRFVVLWEVVFQA
jgi:hypothetical protein